MGKLFPPLKEITVTYWFIWCPEPESNRYDLSRDFKFAECNEHQCTTFSRCRRWLNQ